MYKGSIKKNVILDELLKVTVIGDWKRRKALRAKKKGLFDKEKKVEPQESYVTGGY